MKELSSAVANIFEFVGNNKEDEEGAEMWSTWRKMVEEASR